MKPADLALLRIPGVPTLSPDGRLAVVAVTGLDLDADDYRSELWLVPTDGEAPPRPLTRGWRDTAPRYSPDGRWLAFLRAERRGKPQLYVLPTGGGEAYRLTDHALGAGEPVWSPDSARIAYVARLPEDGRYGTAEDVPPEREPPRRITTLKYRLDDLGFTVDRRAHVFVVDPFAEEPDPVRVTEGDYDHQDVTWSDDGASLAFCSARHASRDLDEVCDVWICSADGSGLRRLTQGRLESSQPRFTPAGVCFVACDLGPEGRDGIAKNTGLWLVPADGPAAPRRLTDEERYNTAHLPVVPIEPADDGVLFPVENRGAVELVSVPYGGGEPSPVLAGPRQVRGCARADGTLVATVAGPASSGEVIAVRDGAERTLTAFGAELAAGAAVRPMEEITATAPDGYPVHGWIVRPGGPGPHPVLLTVHGGPFTQYGWTLFDETQVYADAGYAVVMGNPRGSSGYGQAHGRHIIGDVGARSAADLLALLDAALAAPDLDADRVGVMGGSHGGFMTTWLAARTDRFRAAISERAVNAIDSFTGSSDIGWPFAEELYGPDLAQRDAQSPFTYADDIDIPMLIIHSEQDWRTPLEQAQRLFVALKTRGVETELLLFPGEGHELTRSGLPSHRVARFEAVLDWWSRHL